MTRRALAVRPRPSADRAAALAAVIAALKRRYGEHIVHQGAGPLYLVHQMELPCLSTGSLGLDLVVGGLRRGRITEVAGPEGAGVETLAATALAACQRAGGLALYVDADGAIDPDALRAVGVDVPGLVLATPTTAQEAWAVMATIGRCGAVDLLILASFPGLFALPRAGWVGDRPVSSGYLYRRFGRVLWALHGRRTALLLVNRPPRQAGTGAGPTIGGEAVAQATALRIALVPTGVALAPYGDVAALHADAVVIKHHGLPRGPSIPLTLTQAGVRRAAELVALGRLTGCLAETRLGVLLDGVVLGRSPTRAAATLDADSALAATLEARIRASWGRAPGAAAAMGEAG